MFSPLTKRKKRISIPNFNADHLLGDPFLEMVNSHSLHSLSKAQGKHRHPTKKDSFLKQEPKT